MSLSTKDMSSFMSTWAEEVHLGHWSGGDISSASTMTEEDRLSALLRELYRDGEGYSGKKKDINYYKKGNRIHD